MQSGENLESYGTEFLEVMTSDTLSKVNSTVISMENNFPYKIDYTIELNNWFIKTLMIEIRNTGKSLYLKTNSEQQWFDEKGNEIKELYGAIDIDISCTPFTNTLPINRTKWALNEPKFFKMVYIAVPELNFKKVEQVYTLIQEGKDNRIFHYKSGSFESMIKVAQNGLVSNYPELFKRKY